MDCTEFIRIMNLYFDGDLEEVQPVEVESHLAECPDCCKEMADYQTCLELLRTTFPDQVPPVKLWESIKYKLK